MPTLKYKYNADRVYFFDYTESNFTQFNDIGKIIYFELFQNNYSQGRYYIEEHECCEWYGVKDHDKVLLIFKDDIMLLTPHDDLQETLNIDLKCLIKYIK